MKVWIYLDDVDNFNKNFKHLNVFTGEPEETSIRIKDNLIEFGDSKYFFPSEGEKVFVGSSVIRAGKKELDLVLRFIIKGIFKNSFDLENSTFKVNL